MENPIKMDDLVVPLFLETPISFASGCHFKIFHLGPNHFFNTKIKNFSTPSVVMRKTQLMVNCCFGAFSGLDSWNPRK